MLIKQGLVGHGIAAVLSVMMIGCGSEAAPPAVEGDNTPPVAPVGSPPATENPTPSPAPTPTPPPSQASGAVTLDDDNAAPLSDGSIHVEFLERQLFHPNSGDRTMRDISDLDKSRRVSGGGDFAIGLVLAARNDSPYLLADPRIFSDVVIRGAHGEVTCAPERERYGSGQALTILSLQTSERTPWGNESRSYSEGVWRPSETIRIGVELRCTSAHLQDIDIEAMSGGLTLAARAVYVPSTLPCISERFICDNDVVGATGELELPARALVLQQVQLPTGERGYSAGDLFIHAQEGRIFHDTLSEYGASAFSVAGSDLPAQPELGTDRVDEWSLTLSSVNIRHWTDLPGTPKGLRVVTVNANVAINTGAIEGRLRATVDAAQQALTTATSALAEAQQANDTAAAAAEADEAQQPAADAAADRLRDAESAHSSAERDLSNAQRDHDRAMGSERSRFGRLLSCDRVDLITQGRILRAINGRDMGTSCRTLSDQDAVSVTWIYLTDRYEVPMGITYSIDREPHTQFFASAAFTDFDPR